MSVKQSLDWATRLLAQTSKTARLDALILLEYATGKDRSILLAHPELKLDTRSHTQFTNLIERRALHEPIAYLTHHKEFYGLDFKVTPAVLIPRPETEPLATLAIKLTPKNGSVLDVGTGSGCIAIAIAKNRPDLAITATDVSLPALKIAQSNGKTHALLKPITFLHGDLFENVKGTFNTIVANLPYLPPALERSSQRSANYSPEIKYEPPEALFTGNNGLELYRDFFKSATSYLNPAGHIIIEADPSQHLALEQLAKSANLKLRSCQDFSLTFLSLKPLTIKA